MASVKDLKYGLAGEIAALPLLRDTYDKTLERDSNRYASFDYVNKERTLFVELKTRRNASTQYPTTIVGQNKLLHARSEILRAETAVPAAPKPRFIFAFQFTDGVYAVEYPFHYTTGHVKRRDRQYGAMHAYVAISDLTRLAGDDSDDSDDSDDCDHDSVDDLIEFMAAATLDAPVYGNQDGDSLGKTACVA